MEKSKAERFMTNVFKVMFAPVDASIWVETQYKAYKFKKQNKQGK